VNRRYQEGWTNLLCPDSPIYWGKEGGGCRPACPGELGCFHLKAPPSVGTPWKVQVGLVAICTPLFTKYTPFAFFCWFFSCNVTELYGLRNDTCFLYVMSRNFTDYATIPSLTSGMLRIAQQCFLSTPDMSRNFTDCLTIGVKYLEAVKRRLHDTNKWSPDEIRVWQLPLFTYLLLEIKAK